MRVKRKAFFVFPVIFMCLISVFTYAQTEKDSLKQEYAGSVSCRSCHERFYKLWAPSHHGLAMQPYNAKFASANLTAQKEAIKIGESTFLAEIGPDEGWVLQSNPDDDNKYSIVHAMGGKNVYYFLTPLEKGRLQTLPVAYDVIKKKWFDTAVSGVRHFPGHGSTEAVSWKDPFYTFNTSCYSCHVSQLTTNYDIETDSYNTVWAEPGINCETCHGPGEEHIRVFQQAEKGETLEDIKLISTKPFTAEQMNSMCASCHAKLSSISTSFMPGERYFDNFDLVTLEHPDYYPDGRDLGENYTYTSWLMSPCVKSSDLDCIHCHTSSGRYRFKEDSIANNACLPCHKERVEKATEHSHHESESEGNKCISCHMPMTGFARMNRSDHSMRPPMPAATIKLMSPNACNNCHKNEDATWADKYVRQWRDRDYQRPTLKLARWIQQARISDWSNLPEVLNYLQSAERDEVFSASLIRLMLSCESDKKWPVLIKILQQDTSALVRASAADALDRYYTPDSIKALLTAATDDYRLVRIRTASSLAALPRNMIQQNKLKDLDIATAELIESYLSRPDDYLSHYNLGNFYMDRSEHQKAISSFITSSRLRPDSMLALNNIAFAYNAIGQNEKGVSSLKKALKIDPENAATNLNLGMLLGEMDRTVEAERAFRAAFKSDPNSSAAAYNLGVILVSDRPGQSLDFCKKAYELNPENGKYGYTYAFYLYQNGLTEDAVEVLEDIVKRQIPYVDAYTLLGAIYLRQGELDKAAEVYTSAQKNRKLSQIDRKSFEEMIQTLQQ
ncbi:MAG: tetratricopeptide repeat protein [Planctomycetota bacterium]